MVSSQCVTSNTNRIPHCWQACAFGVLACFIGETHRGLGHYSRDIGLEDLGPLSKWTFFHAIVIVLGISSVKMSLAFFLLRFASQNKRIKRFIIGALGQSGMAC